MKAFFLFPVSGFRLYPVLCSRLVNNENKAPRTQNNWKQETGNGKRETRTAPSPLP
jgi:hypothetical protein